MSEPPFKKGDRVVPKRGLFKGDPGRVESCYEGVAGGWWANVEFNPFNRKGHPIPFAAENLEREVTA